jgi:Xaa-Pro aminopeptidase
MRVPATVLLLLGFATALPALEISREEYAERRGKISSHLSDGLLLLHARSTEAAFDQHGFKQDASFFYFTGLARQPSAILVIDGPEKKSLLFVPKPPESFGIPVENVSLAPGEKSARDYGFDEVAPWEELVPYLRKRVSAGVKKFYLDAPRGPEMPGNPPGLWPVAGDKGLWRRSIAQVFSDIELANAEPIIREMRWVKSASEIAVLREVGRTSGQALLAGMHAIEPESNQRITEAAVVSGCIEAGAEGPSFWPWIMSGPNAHNPMLVRSFYDYHHLNRTMKSGELVRMDIGCDLGHYEGDVGRTVPVSGKFTDEQAEAWNLLVDVYRAGLAMIRSGVSRAQLAEGCRKAVAEAEPRLKTDHGRRAAKALVEGGDGVWHIHGVGLDAGEERLERLEAGSVIAFEPMFSVDEDAYYLEDMILVTEEGHEILTKALPYTAEEIEKEMTR